MSYDYYTPEDLLHERISRALAEVPEKPAATLWLRQADVVTEIAIELQEAARREGRRPCWIHKPGPCSFDCPNSPERLVQEALRDQLARAWSDGHSNCKCHDLGMQHANPYETATAATSGNAQPVTHPVAPRRSLPKLAAVGHFLWRVLAGIAADVAGTSAAAREARHGR